MKQAEAEDADFVIDKTCTVRRECQPARFTAVWDALKRLKEKRIRG